MGILRTFLATLVIFCLVFALPDSSPADNSQWLKTYGDLIVNSIQSTSDGGLVAAGAIGLFTVEPSLACVLKLDSGGHLQWQKTYTNARGPWSFVNSIHQTQDNGYILTGTVYSTPNAMFDAWFMKLDRDGNVVWQKVYGRSGYDYPLSIVQISDGGFVATGTRFDASFYYANSWILKLSSSGEIVWAKGLRGSKWAFVNRLHPDSDGKCVATGFLYDRDSGISRGWFFQLDGTGNILWQKVTSGKGWGYLSSVQKTRDDGYIGAGSVYLSTSESSSAWIIKTDASGQIQWQKVYGGFESDYALSIHQTSDSGYIVGGRTQSFAPRTGAIWVFKLNPTGNIGWQRAYSNFKTHLNPWCRQADDGGYFIALKNHMPFYVAVEPHLWVFKTDENGLIENCPLGESTQAKPSAAAIAFRNSHVEMIDIEVATARVPLLTEDAGIIETELCWQAAERPFEVIDWLDRARICLDWPSAVGVGVPGRCAPRNDCFLCPYYLTDAQLTKKIPDFLINIYSELSLILSGMVYRSDPMVALKQLAARFDETTSGPRYTDALKTSIIEKLKRSTKINPQLLGSVVEGINAMELDLISPADSTAKVEAGNYSSVDLNGIALTVFHNVETSGKVFLKLKSGLPAFAKGMQPAWPIFNYEMGFSGKLAKDGFLDISFYINGINLAGRISDLRLLEWDGKTYRDITTHVDSARGIITGRTARPATYVFMNPRSFNEPLLPGRSQITAMP